MGISDVFQKIILEQVHHSQENIYCLSVACCELIKTQYFVGEQIQLHVPHLTKEFSGVVMQVDKEKLVAKSSGSPNSDKENDATMKPYSYTVNVSLPTGDKSIKAVPYSDIKRVDSVPSIEEIGECVSSCASRRGDKSRWIVKDELKQKYGIADKVAPVFASPAASSKTPSTEKKPSLVKSMSSSKQSASSEKSRKQDSEDVIILKDSGESSSSDEGSLSTLVNKTKSFSKSPTIMAPLIKHHSSPKKPAPPKPPATTLSLKDPDPSYSISSSDESSDDDIIPIRRSLGLPPSGKAAGKLIKEKEKERASEKKRMKKEKEKLKKEKEREKRKKEQEEEKAQKRMAGFLKKSSSTATVDLTQSDEESSKPAALLTPAHVLNAAKRKKAMAVLHKSGSVQKKSSAGTDNTKKRPPVEKVDSEQKKNIFDVDSDSSDDLLPLSQAAKTPPKVDKIHKPVTPKSKSLTPSQLLQMRSAATISQLERALKEGPKSRRFQTEVTIAARILNSGYLESIKDPVIKEAVRERQEKFKEEEMLKKMTEEEKAEYLEMKKETQKRKLKEKKRLAALESRKRFEESTLPDLKALPDAELVSTPESVPNECFGDVAMVTEFFSSYSELLNVKDSKVSSYQLMQALDAGKDGYSYVSQILVPLLQTLLQDELAKDYRFLNVALMKLDVNQNNAGEMVRLCLRPRDQDNDDDGRNSEDGVSDTEEASFQPDFVDESILDELDCSEFFELVPSHQLKILVALIHRLLDTYGVNEFQEKSQQEFTEYWKEKIQILHEKNLEREAEKVKMKEAKIPTGGILEAFGLKQMAHEEKKEDGASGDDEGLMDATKRSRRETRAEREEQEKKEKEKRRKEVQALEKIQKREAGEKRAEAGMIAAKRVQKLSCLGTDRNHSRYWMFSKATPGLFIEKGWVSDYIDYSCKIEAPLNSTEEALSVYEQDKPGFGGRDTPSEIEDASVPRVGQNLWFCLKEQPSFEQLLNALHPKGSRESHLRESLNQVSGKITQMLTAENETPELKLVDSKTMMIEAFKEELMNTESRVRSGGLGGVDAFEAWSATLNSAMDPRTMEHVKPKFLKGIMAQRSQNADEQGEQETERSKVSENKTLQQWKNAVRECSTLSKLHVLQQIFTECVQWGKSLDFVKCKICKRKGFDDQLLLCDKCDVGYHTFCLRPRVKRIPEGDWFCPSCKPKHAPRRSRYAEEGPQTEDSDIFQNDSDAPPSARRESKRKKATDKRKRAMETPDLSSDEESRPSRKAKLRAQAAIRECEVPLTRIDLPGQKNGEHTAVSEVCEEILKKLVASRLAACLNTLPKSERAATRSGRANKDAHRDMDLSAVRNKLDQYEDLEEFFEDLHRVLDHGNQVYEGQARKISQLDELSAVLESLKVSYTGKEGDNEEV